MEGLLVYYVQLVPLALLERECLEPEALADHASKQSLRESHTSNVPGVPRGLLHFVWRAVCLWSCVFWNLSAGRTGDKSAFLQGRGFPDHSSIFEQIKWDFIFSAQ